MIILLEKNKAFFYKNQLFFIGKLGLIKFDLANLLVKSNAQLLFGKDFLKLYFLDVKSFLTKDTLLNKINYVLSKLNDLYTKKIVLFGVGFRSWVYKDSGGFDNIIFKVGFSRDLCVKLPLSIKAVSLKPTLVLFKSLDKMKLNQFVSFVRSSKCPDIYKGKGFQYSDEKITLKPGKHK